jgi:flagellar basal-body rod protein FlgB
MPPTGKKLPPVPSIPCAGRAIHAEMPVNRALNQIGTPFANHALRPSRNDPLKDQNGSGTEKFNGVWQMSFENELFGIHGKALTLRSQRLTLLASNIANASTPGYKAQDIDFDKALSEATKDQGTVAGALEKAMGYRVPVQPSENGNTVEMSTEQTLFAENAVKYRTTLSFLEGRLNTITRALKGE